MPNISEDRRALEIIANKPDHPAAPQVMQTLGIDQNDVKAFQISKRLEQENPDDERIGQVRNVIFEKIARARPTEDPKGFGVGGAGAFDRFVAKNLIDQNPQVQEAYFKRRGFDTRFSKDGNLEVRKSGDISFKPVDPEGIDIFDAFDVVGDVLEGAAATLVGGLAGAAALPAGPVAAGAAGLGAGGAVSGAFETGRQAAAGLLGAREEFDPLEVGKQTVAGALIPAAFKGTGAALKGVGKGIGKGISKFQGGLKTTAPEIEAAAKELGAKATPGQLFDSRIVQELESAQVQSGGQIGGIAIRNQVEANRKAVQDAADGIVQGASQRTKFEIGDDVGRELSEGLAQKLSPAEAIYNKYEKIFRRKAFTPNVDPIKQQMSTLKEQLKFDDQGLNIVKRFEDKLDDIKNLDDLKKFRTAVGNELSSDPLNKSKNQILSQLYSPITEARTQTLVDLAEKRGGDFFDVAKDQIELADSIYKNSIDEITSVIMNPGKKIKGSPKKSLQKFLDETPEIARINKILNTNNPKKIEAVKKSFPQVFERLKESKISEIEQAATKGGVVDPLQLSKKVLALPEESANLIFGVNGVKKAKALEMFLRNVPKPVGPSGTPRGFEVFRFRAILDNLQSLRRDFTLNLRTKAPLEQDIFSRIGRAFQKPAPSALGIAGFAGRERDRPQFGRQLPPQIGER